MLRHERRLFNFSLLVGAGLLASYRWVEGRDGGLQLRMHPGPVLRGGSRPLPLPEAGAPEALDDAVLVREVRSGRSPAWFLVRAFHEQWDGSTLRSPTPREPANRTSPRRARGR